MANQLKEQIKDLTSYIQQMRKFSCVKNARGKEGQKLKAILVLIDNQLEMVDREANSLDEAMSARDLTIRALGEKLSVIRSQQSKPFFVVGGNHDEAEDNGAPQIFKEDELEKWSKKKRMSYQNDMLREMARLVTDPMGLEGGARLEMEEEIAANMKFQHVQRGNDIDEITKKTLKLIEVGEMKGVSREKTRSFLLRKQVDPALIEQCFGLFDENNSPLGTPRLSTLRESKGLQRLDSDQSDLSEYEMPVLSNIPKLKQRTSHSAA